MTSKTALVLRATGTQGKDVTHHLLASGWKVHTLVTDPTNERAIALQKQGGGLFKGTLSEPDAIEAAIQGCSALFIAQMPSFTDDTETREATSLLEKAKAAGVRHIVHSTTLPLNDPDVRSKFTTSPFDTLAPAILGKGDVEDLVRSSGIPWTILRPGYFMTNLAASPTSYFPELHEGKFIQVFDDATVLPLVDPYDIGAFAASAFNEPAKYSGEIISVASEKLGIAEIASEIEKAMGRPIEVVYKTKPDNLIDYGQMLSSDLARWVDLEKVKSYGVPLTTFREYLVRNKSELSTQASLWAQARETYALKTKGSE